MPKTENTTTLYTLAVHLVDGESYKIWSHSKLELIHQGQTAIQEEDCTAKVYSVTFENYGTNRQLLVKILNRNPVRKDAKIVWKGKTEVAKPQDVKAIQPIVEQ